MAFDAKTGDLRWTFYPLPEDSPAGAANTWSRIVVDEPNGLVFLPTGSASPGYYGGLRPGDNRDANSIVVLKASTGETVWSFQTVHHDLWDYDVASPPLLFPGKNGPAVAVGSKTGHLFLFDRLTGIPLFPIEERAVPKSDTPAEQASPTQPFPTLPPALAPQQIAEKDIFGATPEDLQFCRDLFHKLRNEGIFTPPSLQGSLHVPGNTGGMHWGGAAWDIAADRNYALLYSDLGEFAVRTTMDALEKRLDPPKFARVSRGSIVRVAAIREVRLSEDHNYTLHLSSGEEIACSKRYWTTALDRLL